MKQTIKNLKAKRRKKKERKKKLTIFSGCWDYAAIIKSTNWAVHIQNLGGGGGGNLQFSLDPAVPDAEYDDDDDEHDQEPQHTTGSAHPHRQGDGVICWREGHTSYYLLKAYTTTSQPPRDWGEMLES